MERPVFLSQKDKEIIESLGGESYEHENEFEREEVHYSLSGGHRERSQANKERIKEIVSIGLLAISLVGCVPSGSEAYTTPFGIVYRDPEPSEWLIDHEECHEERSQEEGLEFWFKYTIDPGYRCEEEIRCGAVDHPYCK